MRGLLPTTERRAWWWVFGLLIVAGTAWAVAVPPMTGPDEGSNAIRAAAVVRGQIAGDPMPELVSGSEAWENVMVEVDVPASLAGAEAVGACYLGEPRERFFGATVVPRGSDCPELSGDTGTVTTPTYEYRGPPFYYALVGLPTLVSVDDAGALGMRMVGVLLAAGLLASAIASIRRLPVRARALTALGAAVAVTPELVYLGGMQNAASVEIAASLAVWTSGLALVVAPAEPDGRLVHRTGVALVVLILTRGLSPAFAALAVLVLLAVTRPGRVRALLGRTDVRAWIAGGATATVVAGAWLWAIHHLFPLHGYPPTGLDDAVGRVPWWVQGMVAVFGSTDVVPPAALHWAWGAMAVVVLGLAAAAGSRRHLLLAVGLVVVGLALLISGEGFGVPQTGFWWQGRYVLPCIVGALVLAPAGVRERSPADRGDGSGNSRSSDDETGTDLEGYGPGMVPGWLRWTAAALLGLFVAGHAWSFTYALRHYTVGHDGPRNPARFLFDPIWSPPLPPALLLLVFVAAITGLALVLRAVALAPADGAGPADADGRDDAREPGDAVEYGRGRVMAGKGG